MRNNFVARKKNLPFFQRKFHKAFSKRQVGTLHGTYEEMRNYYTCKVEQCYNLIIQTIQSIAQNL